ncbi:thiamine monophosphate synthase/TENI-domain-containing protein [Morchella snyderi]|nr:thiamine monophosphate synthase/TENI-domain-containing protein [Morchella snyderi]
MTDFSLYVVINPNMLRVFEELPPPFKGRNEGLPHQGLVVDVQKVKDLIDAGATAIKLRGDSTIDTSDYTKLAKGIHEVTKKHNIPLFIHDRVDIAMASGVDGVEVGKGCLDYMSTRKIMGPEKLIGVSITNKRQAQLASRVQTAYQVIGPVYEPLLEVESLQVTPLGAAGARDILSHAVSLDTQTQFLLAGGITPENVRRVITQSRAPLKRADGVVLGYDPNLGHVTMVARILETKNLINAMQKSVEEDLASCAIGATVGSADSVFPDTKKLPTAKVSSVIASISKHRPSFRCIVPEESKDITKGVSAVIGSVPEYSLVFEEMKYRCDNLQQPQSCLISMGTASTVGYIVALKLYNLKAFPVILEPKIDSINVHRSAAAESLLAAGSFALIKGTVEEILHLSDMCKNNVQKTGNIEVQGDLASIVSKECKELALRENCAVLSTGSVYVLSDGIRTIQIKNGSHLLNTVGNDALGPILAACLAIETNDPFVAILSGLLLFTIASDQAATNVNTKGPGTFIPALIDEIWKLSKLSLNGDGSWVEKAVYERFE